jgi:hypothetical protein
VLVRVVVGAVERAGVPRATLLEAAGIDASRLAEVHERFELREIDHLQLRALELTGDAALGLHIAALRRPLGRWAGGP